MFGFLVSCVFTVEARSPRLLDYVLLRAGVRPGSASGVRGPGARACKSDRYPSRGTGLNILHDRKDKYIRVVCIYLHAKRVYAPWKDVVYKKKGIPVVIAIVQ